MHMQTGRTESTANPSFKFGRGPSVLFLTLYTRISQVFGLNVRMRPALSCELWFFLFFPLLSNGQAQDAVLTTDPNWSTFYIGESVTFVCDMNEGDDADWEYKIDKGGRDYISYNTHKRYSPGILSEGNSGDYQCVGRQRSSYSTKNSNTLSLTVSAKPRATLTAGTTTIPVGGSVTLTCSVQNSDGWKYEWFRRTEETREVPVDPVRTNDEHKRVISVSQGGIYRCRGTRGKPVYLTHISDGVTIEITFSIEAVLRRQPDWAQMFNGERITLTCEVHGGETTQWMYEWRRPGLNVYQTNGNYQTLSVSESSSGDYMCRSRLRDDSYSSTEWSKAVTLSVSADKPRPVLTVSPSWLSPGASVTLSCEVEHPSAGWRFYWYQTVPDISGPSYSYELLPGSINGTEQDSYIIDGQTQTAGYACRAGRGDTDYSTDYSKPAFVWSGDLHSAASLTVDPDTVQHFASKSVSLSCEGNSTNWRVSMFTDNGNLLRCSGWGTMIGSTCHVNRMWYGTVVYWCESGSAFSNAVNITGQFDDGVILVSPVHHVTEGDSVTFGCKLRTQNVRSNVLFYKDDKLIQNDSRGEMRISAVSKSDEGFYKCQYSGGESAQSWMAVKKSSSVNSSFPALLITGLVCGVLLIILLLLLFCCYKQSKDSCFIRSQSSNQSSAADDTMNQDEALNNECVVPVNGDSCLYESVKDADKDESSDVTYSAIELKNVTKKEKKNPESAVYSVVKRRSDTDDSLTYAQVLHHKKGKAKRDKGESAAEETVYSEVKPGRAADQ